MDWDTLLDELWFYTATEPSELEARIRSCLKGHPVDGLLNAVTLLNSQGQHAAAKSLLAEFLKSHHAASDILRRLELVLHFQKHKQSRELQRKSRLRNRESILHELNRLVASSELSSAEELLQEVLRNGEDPEYLDLLSRVFILQRRPADGVIAMQRAQRIRRQQEGFVKEISDSEGDELPDAADLAFIRSNAEVFSALEASVASAPISAGPAGRDLENIQELEVQFPTLADTSSPSPSPSPSAIEDYQFDELPTSEMSHQQGGLSEAIVTVDEAERERRTSFSTVANAAKPKPTLPGSRIAKTTSDGDKKVRFTTKPSRIGSWNKAEFESFGEDVTVTDQPSSMVSSDEAFFGDESPAYAPVEPESEPYYNEADDDPFDSREMFLRHELESSEFSDDVENDGFYATDLSGLSVFDPSDEPERYSGQGDSPFEQEIEDDYSAYEYNPDEVFETGDWTTEFVDEGLDGRISREERALQKAAELIGKVGWPLSALPLVQQIFVTNGWGATRVALEREIERGLIPEELILAARIKVIWAENDIYWISFDKTGSSRLSYHVLSWPTALLIIHSFESLPQIEELEVYLEQIFESWYGNMALRRVFKAFARYLWFRFSSPEGCLPASVHFDFGSPHALPSEEFSDLGLQDELEFEKIKQLRMYGVFQNKHPQEPGCYFSDLPADKTKKQNVATTDSCESPLAVEIAQSGEEAEASDVAEGGADYEFTLQE